MRSCIFFSVCALVLFCAVGVHAQCPPPTLTGLNEIIEENFYVVHSDVVHENSQTLINTSNIYVLRGCSDSVWIFGSGYGDDGDIAFYRPNSPMVSGRGVEADAADVDSVIRTKFGFSRSSAVVQFIVPHFHLDHFNREILHELFLLGYDSTVCRIHVHVNDYAGASCNSPCCDSCQTLCCQEGDDGFGAPFDPELPYISAYFNQVGGADDNCGAHAMRISTPTGRWRVDKGRDHHSPGTLNVLNTHYKLFVLGAGSLCSQNGWSSCPGLDFSNWEVLPIHGDREDPDLSYAAPQSNRCFSNGSSMARHGADAQPYLPQTGTLHVAVQAGETINLPLVPESPEAPAFALRDLNGRAVQCTFHYNGHVLQLDTGGLGSGLYVFILRSATGAAQKGLVLVY